MSVEDTSASPSDQVKHPRIPLLVVACIQFGIAGLLFVMTGFVLLPPVNLNYLLLMLPPLLLICSAVALLRLRPGSWWTALLVQSPLLAGAVGVALDRVHALPTYQPQYDPHGVGPMLNTLIFALALLLGLCSLTALLYLLRPRSRESYGLPATSREPLQLSARACLYFLLGVVCLGLVYFPTRRIVLSYRLWEAIEFQDTATITWLLKAGADVDFRDAGNGRTPLLATIHNGMYEKTQVLLKAGANVNAHNACGDTPLLSASGGKSEGIVKALLAAGANVNAQDNSGQTSLMTAAENGNTQIAKLLLTHGANPNAQRDGGVTVLMSASAAGQKEIGTLLLTHGAVPIAKPKLELEPQP